MSRIAVLPGDGIGPEVTAPAVADLGPGHELVQVDAGAEQWLATGHALTDEQVATIAGCDALLFGAIGDPRVPPGVLEGDVLLRLRRELDLYMNLRPVPEIGVTIVRENTEGLYSGCAERSGDVALETSVNTRARVERCLTYGFRLAESRGESLTWVHKTNVLTAAGSLWAEVVAEVHERHPDVEVRYDHVDASAYHLVRSPGRYGVIVTDNLFGDILSDVAAAAGGGLGAAASANLHPRSETRPARCVGLFEPVHGSAPDIAGRGIADVTGARRAAAMLVEALEREVQPA